MLNNCSLGLLLLVILAMAFGFPHVTEAGACWIKRMENGKCKEMYSKNVSKEECCKRGQEFGFTEREMSDVEIFFATAIGEGASCVSCLDSCEIAQCGPGKRCVIRKGYPKCVCAPICKVNRRHKKGTLKILDTKQKSKHKVKKVDSHSDVHNILKNNSLLQTKSIAIEANSTQMHRKMEKNQRSDSIIERNDSSLNGSKSKNTDNILSLVKDSHPSSNDKIIMTADNIGLLVSSGKLKKNSSKQQKSMKTNSKNIVFFENSSSNQKKPLQPPSHHNRHQSKKLRKFMIQKVYNHSVVNDSDHVSTLNGITLDEKLRNDFFRHGFPYPTNDLTKNSERDRYYNPVCGSDGKTYRTECQMKKKACRHDSRSLIVAYRGHCQTSCKLVQCLKGLTCVEDHYGIPHCISCSITCPQDDISKDLNPNTAVCGVDGQTYRSICDINKLICSNGRSIPVAYYGPCQESVNCNNIVCGDKKICLSDLTTSMPRCVSCNFKCPRKRRPQGHRYEDGKICGNNNHTYNSWCQMRRDSCNTGFYIDIKHIGACNRSSFVTKSTLTQD